MGSPLRLPLPLLLGWVDAIPSVLRDGGGMVFGIGMGEIFAARALSVGNVLTGNLVLHSARDPTMSLTCTFDTLAMACKRLRVSTAPAAHLLERQTLQTNPTSTTLL